MLSRAVCAFFTGCFVLGFNCSSFYSPEHSDKVTVGKEMACVRVKAATGLEDSDLITLLLTSGLLGSL